MAHPRSEPHATPSEGRDGSAIQNYPALDGLRGLAIALVVGVHFGTTAQFTRVHGRLGEWIDRLFYVGWAGVDLFFVLSGFLITSILLATRHDPSYFGRFYGRRALRIFPLYFTAVAFALWVVPALWPDQASRLLEDATRHQGWLWTYTLNIAWALGWIGGVGMLAQMWSLAIEEQFYLLWPLLVRRLDRNALLRVCAAAILAAPALRVAWLHFEWPTGWPGAYRFTLTRVDGLAMGAALALLWGTTTSRHHLVRMARPVAAAGGAILLMAFLALPRFYPDQPLVVTAGHSVLGVTFAALVVLGLHVSPPAWMVWTPLRTLGVYSYGLYVWHWIVHQWVSPSALAMSPWMFVVLGSAASVAASVVSYHALEAPFLRLKHWFSYGVADRRAESDATA